MGRKRIDEQEKKVLLTISIKKKYVEALRQQEGLNISKLLEEYVKKYLKM